MIKIGAKFQEARIKKGLTLDEISKITKIRKEFLEAIENGEYKRLPSSAYAYGFVRNYAKFLGLDENKTISLFKREFDSDGTFEVLPKFATQDEISFKKLRIGRNFILAFGIFIILIFFILFQYKDAIFNPTLKVASPKEGETISSSDLQVSGITDPNSVVYVENQLVSLDSEGNFKKTITVFPGKNLIDIKSVNRFGKQSEVKRHINVKLAY